MATELYIGNADWPGNNVRIWRARQTSDKPYEDGRWRFMMYDTDDSMGMLAKAKYDTDPFLDKNHWKSGPLNESCLLGLMLTKLLENAQFKNMFRQTFIRIGSENFSLQKVNELLDETSSLLKEPMTLFYKRFVSEDANTYNQTYFLNKVDVISEFFEKRYSYALGYLNDHIPA